MRKTINNNYYFYNHITIKRWGKSAHLVLQIIIQWKYNINYYLRLRFYRLFLQFCFCARYSVYCLRPSQWTCHLVKVPQGAGILTHANIRALNMNVSSPGL